MKRIFLILLLTIISRPIIAQDFPDSFIGTFNFSESLTNATSAKRSILIESLLGKRITLNAYVLEAEKDTKGYYLVLVALNNEYSKDNSRTSALETQLRSKLGFFKFKIYVKKETILLYDKGFPVRISGVIETYSDAESVITLKAMVQCPPLCSDQIY